MPFSDPDLDASMQDYQRRFGNTADPYDPNIQALDRWSLAQSARAQAALPPENKLQTRLDLLNAANAGAADSGLPKMDTTAAQNDLDRQATMEAMMTPKAAGVAPAAAIDPNVPPNPIARSLNPNGELDTSKLTAQQLAHLSYSSVDPATVGLGQQAYDKASKLVMHEQAALGDMLKAQKASERDELLASDQAFDARAAKNSELETVSRNRAERAAQEEIRTQKLVAEANSETKAQMARIRQTSDDAANAQINDFWADKTTGGRILGIISQALAGASNGLSGQPGAPTPLDRIIQADLEKQRINLNQKTTTAYREQGILGLMQKQFDSTLQANGAAYLASLNHVDALVKDIAQRYDTPEAKAAQLAYSAKVKNQYSQAAAQLHNGILTSALQQQNIASSMISHQASASAAVAAANARAAGQRGQQHIMGLKGPVNDKVFGALQKHSGAVASMMNSYDNIQGLLSPGRKLDLDWRTEFNANRSQIFAALRTEDETGAALNKVEATNLETRVPEMTMELISRLSDKQLLDYSKQLSSMKNAVLGGYGARIKAVSGVDYDYDDPQIGSSLAAMAKPAQAQ